MIGKTTTNSGKKFSKWIKETQDVKETKKQAQECAQQESHRSFPYIQHLILYGLTL